jgi:hypothetical protein
MTMFNTLLLDQTAWDLVEDAAGNIAMASPPYGLAQDVASAVRLFLNECWYDTTKGIPYFQEVLGQLPPSSLLVELIRKQALTVPGVVAARCIIQSFNERTVTGQVQFTDESGVTTIASF